MRKKQLIYYITKIIMFSYYKYKRYENKKDYK